MSGKNIESNSRAGYDTDAEDRTGFYRCGFSGGIKPFIWMSSGDEKSFRRD